MKRFVLFAIVGLLAVGTAQAAEFTVNPNPPTTSSAGPYVPDLPNITQSTDPNNVVAATGVACTDGTAVSDNHFIRRFFLNADHGIVVQYNVTSVDFGIESITYVNGTSAPVEMRTYSIAHGAAFQFANMTLLNSTTRNLPNGTALSIENFPVGGSILDPAATDLVVDMYWADVTTNSDWLGYPGANSAGESQPGYIASDGCGIPNPVTYASIGFPDCHLVVTVNGDEQVVPTSTPPPATTGEPVPALNAYGMIAMVVLLVGVAVLVMWRRS
jgi:hypothetical protein